MIQPENQPKILFFVESGGPGGAERVVLSLAQGLLKEGISVAVATLRVGWFTEQLTKREIPHILVNSNRKYDIGLILKLRKIIREGNYNVLHSHLLDSNCYAALACFGTKTRHVATEHGDVHHTKKKKLLKLKLKLLAFLGDKITAVSNYTAEAMISRGVPKSKIAVVGNPILLSAIDKDDVVAKQPQENWSWIHVANLRPVKDQETLIRGFAKSLKHSSTQQTLTIVGEGSLREQLEMLVHELEVTQYVSFLGHRDDIATLLKQADGFILSSRSEAMPMALLEAMHCGLVTLGSRVGGIPELLENNRGYLFNSGDANSLAECIVEVLRDQPHAYERALIAKKFVHEYYSLKSVIELYSKLYSCSSR